MHSTIPHRFSKSEAAARIKAALQEARPQIAGKADIHEERWEGDRLHFDFTVEGQRISGTLTIEDSRYVLDAKLPLMLRLFEGRIEKAIEEQAKTML